MKFKNFNYLEIFYAPRAEIASVFQLRDIPTTVFIDRNGYEFARIIGYIDFKNKNFLK